MIVQIVAAQYPERTRSMVSIYSTSAGPAAAGKPEALDHADGQPERPGREQLVKARHEAAPDHRQPGYPAPEAELRAFVEKNIDRRWYPEGRRGNIFR